MFAGNYQAAGRYSVKTYFFFLAIAELRIFGLLIVSEDFAFH